MAFKFYVNIFVLFSYVKWTSARLYRNITHKCNCAVMFLCNNTGIKG